MAGRILEELQARARLAGHSQFRDPQPKQQDTAQTTRTRGALNRAGTGIVLHGVDRLVVALDRVGAIAREIMLRQTGRDAAEIIAAEARRLCPVDTGTLKDSIHVVRGKVSDALRSHAKAAGGRTLQKFKEIENTTYNVMCGDGFFFGVTYYSGMVEFGTKKWAGKPFMRPAARNKIGPIRQLYKAAVRKVTTNAARRKAANVAINAFDIGVDG